MLCEDCRKKAATIFFKEVLPGKVVELHLCESCAQKRGLLMAQKLSPIEILQKLLREKSAKDEKVICPVCFLSLAEFKREADDVLEKPTSAEEMLAKITRVLNQTD